MKLSSMLSTFPKLKVWFYIKLVCFHETHVILIQLSFWLHFNNEINKKKTKQQQPKMCIFNGMDRDMSAIYSMPCLELLTHSLKGIQMARDGGASTGRAAPAPVAAGASLPPVTAA